jgi:hypothetical protein
MIERLIDKYTISFICFLYSIFILIFQFLFPDLVPDAIQKAIDNAPPEQIGLVPTLNAFLIFYTWSGLISFIVGIVSAVVKYFRSIGE